MKSLLTHIYEKLVINKNYNNPNPYKKIMPVKDVGKCLIIAIPTKFGNGDRIVMFVYDYYFDIDKNCYVSCGFEMHKNDDGYMYLKGGSKEWHWIALFENDAISFLTELLNDIKQKIDVTEFVKSNKNIICSSFCCINNVHEYYDKQTLHLMINKIKDK